MKMEILTLTVRIYSQDIEVEFGMGKCATLICQKATSVRRNSSTKLRKKSERSKKYNYLRILEADIIKQEDMKEK